MPVEILRPPVVLIHGLWDNAQTWNNFSPLVGGPGTVDPRFYIGRVSYSYPIGGSIATSDPAYSRTLLNQVLANSLGFAFNAPLVAADIAGWVDSFKQANNPLGIPVAAVQADIVAHSMGGDIARMIPSLANFTADSTFGEGDIHKLITIDTPHLGSPLAADLVSPQENGGCLENLLAGYQKFAFSTVVFGNDDIEAGAMLDLTPGSYHLSVIAGQGPHQIPTAPIVGIYTNFSALDSLDDAALLIRNWPFGCPNDPLAQDLTSTGWPQLFQGQPNDAIVSEDSQLDDLAPDPNSQFFGYVHSTGTEKLGFKGPSVLDSGAVPNQVITLLNTPWTNGAYYYLLNP